MLTIGDVKLPVYFGERLTLSTIDSDGNMIGTRTGDSTGVLMINRFDKQTNGYWYFGLLNSSTNYYELFAFNFNGLNRIGGITAVSEKSNTSEEWVRDLFNGMHFIGSRINGKTTQNLVATKSVESTQSVPYAGNRAKIDAAIYATQSELPPKPVDDKTIKAFAAKINSLQ